MIIYKLILQNLLKYQMYIFFMPVSISESAALNMPADDNEVITRGVTIHRYIDTMYDDTMHRCTRKISMSGV